MESMWRSLKQRIHEPEWMDLRSVDPAELDRSLRFIRRINRMLGYTRATLWHLERFSRGWKPRQTIHIIDFATGSADIPRAILRWSDARGLDVRVVGIDLHPVTAQVAARESSDDRLRIVQSDVLALPFAPASFDYAITNMFLHHLSDQQVVQVLRSMDRVARRGIIAADLLRHRRAYAWITLLTLLSSPMLKHDARVSVARAFTRREVLELRARAAVDYAEYFRHFGHRFVIAGQKAH